MSTQTRACIGFLELAGLCEYPKLPVAVAYIFGVVSAPTSFILHHGDRSKILGGAILR